MPNRSHYFLLIRLELHLLKLFLLSFAHCAADKLCPEMKTAAVSPRGTLDFTVWNG
jgi:hypothetical protein